MPTITLNPTVGVAPGTTTMTLGAAKISTIQWWPYTDDAKLRGLGGLGAVAPRWGLVLFAGLAVFAGTLAFKRLRR